VENLRLLRVTPAAAILRNDHWREASSFCLTGAVA
jgi:hypothetical protein